MRKILALLTVFIFVHALSADATAPATCAISGVVYDGAANPVPNATIYFNSRSVQVVNANVINPILKTSSTDANGNLSTTALVQGLFVQITICQAQGGGCGSPTTGYVPIASSTSFANLLAGQSTIATGVLTGPLNAAGFRIYNVGANTTADDALSQGQSSLNNLAAPTGTYGMNNFKLTGLEAGTGSGDSLAFGLNHLNDLATATGSYSMGGNSLTGVANLTIPLGTFSGPPVNIIDETLPVAEVAYKATFSGSGAPSPFSVAATGVHFPSSTIANLPSCGSGTTGNVFTVLDSDSACSFNATPTHSSCTVGGTCYTCQVQCAEAGSTSYAWIAY